MAEKMTKKIGKIKSPERLYSLGLDYYDSGELSKAKECHQRALELRPTFAEAWIGLGLVYRKGGEVSKAIECYEKALELKPNSTEGWNNLGSAYYYSNEFSKAIVCYQKALELQPTFASAWIGLGSAYCESGDLSKAVECYQKALELEPDNQTAQGNLKLVYGRLGKPFDLQKVLKEITQTKEERERRAEEEEERKAPTALKRERETMFRKIIKRFAKISIKEMAELLQFGDQGELKRWIIDLPEEIELYIEGEEVIIPRVLQSGTAEAEMAIEKLLKSFEEFEQKGRGKR